MAALANDEYALVNSVLGDLERNGSIADSWPYAIQKNIAHNDVVGAIKKLDNDEFTVSTVIEAAFYEVTEEGWTVVKEGSPESRLFAGIPDEGILDKDLQVQFEPLLGKEGFKAGFSMCMKNKLLTATKVDKKTKMISKKAAAFPEDTLVDTLKCVAQANGDNSIMSEGEWKILSRRKLVVLVKRKSFNVQKGRNFASTFTKPVAELTEEMLRSGAWKTAAFKGYNFTALGANVGGGHLHPLMKVRKEFRMILLQMGFEEMPTNKWVESGFWNFDALFQPQQHPARDSHDTFFIKGKAARTNRVPDHYLERVKQVHSKGGFGSIGYRMDWSLDESFKNLLRTHTTAISAQMLYRLGQECADGKPFTPKKYFSVDRVFRNETMDATHLAEFHQVEGLVADRGLGLGHLKGIIHEFFRKIGITQLRFKPAFNPYTEPSMEIFGYHPDLKKWTEIGNSGIFRPEMCLPMGLPEDVRVIAWGLSLERPTMIKYRIDNIRTLFGHKCDIDQTNEAPICRF